jgi:hypothetical protein
LVAQGDLAAAVDALTKLRAVLATELAVDDDVRPELLNQVDKATAELASERPVLGRITEWLGGVSAVVQTIGAAQPAWDVVKHALLTVGVQL